MISLATPLSNSSQSSDDTAHELSNNMAYSYLTSWLNNSGQIPSVGYAVGNSVGLSVGSVVGSVVGISVGKNVSELAGSAVGLTEGCPVGSAVGFFEGCSVGS